MAIFNSYVKLPEGNQWKYGFHGFQTHHKAKAGCESSHSGIVEDCHLDIWQCVKTNSTPVVHIKIAGIYGCE